MKRFFSPKNLERYRKLASGAIGKAEQHDLLKALTEEMEAFRREVWAIDCPPSRTATLPEIRHEHTR
jgi:hypothetical protein